ncbi:hypothetical protein ASG54_07255 [Aureimonas sp. Leaf460]|nr:hypothetical protein ASG62_13405 [Aureimonas sp. Leaf427]KQT80363.1 hypothetical protein ASG54_07255 [Aureimonas sp. Leaf460]
MSLLKTFFQSRRGNFAVIAALATVPIVIGIGGSVDYAKMIAERRKVLGSLDAAILAGAKAPPGNEVATANAFFAANMGADAKTYKPTFTLTTTGDITGAVSGSAPTSFLKLAQIPKLDFNVANKASLPKIISVTFTPTGASGWYPKTIFVFTKDKDGKILMKKDVITYDYNIVSGKKTIVPPLKSASETYVLGSTYDTFGVGMIVWDQFQDQRKGSTKTYWSDAADASKRLQVVGKCRPTQENHWEDGGDTNYKDFEYDLTCNSDNKALYVSQ